MSEPVLDVLREEVPREIDERVGRYDEIRARGVTTGRCIQASHVGYDALRYFGVASEPVVTLAMAGNEAWAEWMLDGSPEPMPDEAWSVGVDHRLHEGGRGFPGHLVLVGEFGLLDLDAGWFSRPEKGMAVPATLLAWLNPHPSADRALAGWQLPEGGVVLYGKHFNPPNYRATGAWRDTGKWAGPVIRRMKRRLT